MKRSFFPFLLQTIRIHYQDPELAFYTKGVLGLLWLVQLPVALWYGAQPSSTLCLEPCCWPSASIWYLSPANTAARTITLPLP